jgi:hypothetical protein
MIVPGCSPTSATSTGSPAGITSRPGTGPRHRMPPPASSSGTGCRVPATGGLTSAAHHGRRPAAQPRPEAAYYDSEIAREDSDGGHALP